MVGAIKCVASFLSGSGRVAATAVHGLQLALDRLSESIAWSSRKILPSTDIFIPLHCNKHNSGLKDKTLHPKWRLNSFYRTQQDFSRS